MHTQETEQGVGTAAKQVAELAEHASALVRLELELAAARVKRKVSSLAIGATRGLAAAVLLLFALGFGLATVAAAIATATSTWLALLIVTGLVVLLALVLGGVAMTMIKRGSPPVPKQALHEAKLTTEALKGDGDHHV